MFKLRAVVLSAAFLLLAGSVSADVLFKDDFEDGVVDASVYVVVGNAIVTESGGKLRVQTFGVGDGVEIAIPKGAQCVTLSQTVPQSELDRREGYGLAGIFQEATGEETVGVALETRRPFWNRCQVTIKVGKDKQVAGFWG